MRILLIILAAAVGTGCAEIHRPLLGTRVHTFTVGGRDLVHCSILVDRSEQQMTHDAIEVCRDAVQEARERPVPLKR